MTMRISKLRVAGFRSLAEVEFRFRDFAIMIGRNNSGKSNVLSAIRLLLEGTTRDLSEGDFHGEGEGRVSEITIEAVIEGVTNYLDLCAQQHRTESRSVLTTTRYVFREKQHEVLL